MHYQLEKPKKRLKTMLLAGAVPLCFLNQTQAQEPAPAPAPAPAPGQPGQNTPGAAGGAGQTAQPPQNPVTPDRATETPAPPLATSPNVLPTQLTLAQAIEYGLRLQPSLASAIANREATQERRRAVQATYYPQLRPTYQFVYQYVFGTVNQFAQSSSGAAVVVPVQQGRTTDTRQAELGLSYRLFDNGLREANQRQARQTERAALYAESNTRLTIIGNVADFYFNTLRTQALVQVQQAQVARAQNTLRVVEAQVNVGVTAPKDIFQARADLANAQVQLLQARNNAAIAQANLKQSIGVVGGEPLQLADVLAPQESTPITAVPEAPTVTKSGDNPEQQAPAGPGVTPPAPQNGLSGIDPGGDADLINRYAQAAYVSRPDVAQQRQTIEANQTAATIQRINTGTQIVGDFSVAQQYNARTFDSAIGNNRQISIAASYPLFDGGQLRANQRAARAQVRTSEANLANLRLQVAFEVEQAYRTLAQARATLPAARAAQAAAQINYDAAIESQREGVGSIVEVITAQTQLVQAQTNYVQAIYDFYSADARLTRAVGQGDRVPAIGGTAPTNPSPVPIAPVTDTTGNPVPPPAPAPSAVPGTGTVAP